MISNEQKLRIRFTEALQIYQDSPSVTLSYADAVRIYEDLNEILDVIEQVHAKKVGFIQE